VTHLLKTTGLYYISAITVRCVPVSSHSIFRIRYRTLNFKKRNRKVTKINFYYYLHFKVS